MPKGKPNAKKEIEKSTRTTRWKPTEEEMLKARMLAARGLTDRQIIGALGYLPTSAPQRLRWNPDLADQIEIGRSQGMAQVANALYDQAVAGNVQAQKFWLERVGNWRETSVVEHTGETKQTIQIVMPKMLSEEEWVRANAFIQQQEAKALELKDDESEGETIEVTADVVDA